MTDWPSTVEPKQLRDLHIELKVKQPVATPPPPGEERHVGGRELLLGIKEYASDQFGPMAPLVFERWGVRRPGDFGEIVFNLIDAELLSRRPSDARLDFVSGVDFHQVFAEKHRESLDRIATK